MHIVNNPSIRTAQSRAPITSPQRLITAWSIVLNMNTRNSQGLISAEGFVQASPYTRFAMCFDIP